MDGEVFYKTIVETLKYDNKYADLKDDLLAVISRSEIQMKQQFEFTSKYNQRWEDVDLRVPIPLINLANKYEQDIQKLFRYVYQEDDENDIGEIYIKPKVALGENPPIENDVAFEEIQEKIIQGIRDAKYLIWIAVAWFSNDVFYRELKKRKAEGLNIRIIESDEEGNRDLLPSLQENFETIVVPRSGPSDVNRMHDKFCIIDLEYVMHGSYNWTKAANYNGETLVTSVDKKLVRKFAMEFNDIVAKNSPTTS